MHTPTRSSARLNLHRASPSGTNYSGTSSSAASPGRRPPARLLANLLTLASLCGLCSLCGMASAQAASAEQAKGLWLSADKAAIIEFKECADNKEALCGKIVWDKDAGTPLDACGVMIAKMKKYDDEAWRDGWVHDPRSKKNYKGVIRVKNDILQVRAFIGTELLGETEEMTRAASLPAGCKK